MKTTQQQIQDLKDRMMRHGVNDKGEATVVLHADELHRIIEDLELLSRKEKP